MIILGSKGKASSIAASIREHMSGKGMSDEDLKYNPEAKQGKESGSELQHYAGMLIESIHAKDSEKASHALKEFIEICLKNS